MELFLMGLLASSVLTSLVTESFKTMMEEIGKKVYSNVLAGIASVVSSLAIGFGYIIVNDYVISSKVIICIVALVALSWLCAMVGYDKVIQAIGQIRKQKDIKPAEPETEPTETKEEDQNG